MAMLPPTKKQVTIMARQLNIMGLLYKSVARFSTGKRDGEQWVSHVGAPLAETSSYCSPRKRGPYTPSRH
jgi:hypothetical protein